MFRYVQDYWAVILASMDRIFFRRLLRFIVNEKNLSKNVNGDRIAIFGWTMPLLCEAWHFHIKYV